MYKKDYFFSKGQSLVSVIVIPVVIGLIITSGLYLYFSKQIPNISEIAKNSNQIETTKNSVQKETTSSDTATVQTIPEITENPIQKDIVAPKSSTSSQDQPLVPISQSIPIPIPNPESIPISEPIKLVSNSCSTIFQNGSPSTKINIYFYEDGFNSDIEVYNNYVGKIITKIFGGSFIQENFPGIEPFKSLKGEFNAFSLSNDTSDNYTKGQYTLVAEDLQQNCPGFVKPSDWGVSNGNYNIIIVPSKKSGQAGTSRSVNRLNETTVRLSSADIIHLRGINLYNVDRDPLVHELGHRIGYFDEEYSFYDLYLGAKTTAPNIDSFSCTKWCQGVDTQSACYQEYTKWIDCFKTKTIDKSNEIQDILQNNNLNYTTSGNYDWWGICFNGRNINICGQKIANVVISYIRPEVQGLNKAPNQEWISNWESCKNEYPNVAGVSACNLGLNCEQDVGCYAGTSFSRFLPSRESQFIMGRDTRTADKFNAYDEEILRYNILNKIRYIDVENIKQ